jgi:hypothetical protein
MKLRRNFCKTRVQSSRGRNALYVLFLKIKMDWQKEKWVRTSLLEKFIPICLCVGGLSEFSAMCFESKLILTSNKRYAQSRLQNSFAFSLDFNIEVSLFEIATVDMSAIESAFTSRNKDFSCELWMFCASRKESYLSREFARCFF